MNSEEATNTDPKPIHVMHLVNSLEPGGLENGVVNIVNQLARPSFRSSIVCLNTVGEFAERVSDDVDISCLNRPNGFSIPTVRKMAALLKKERPDVLHTHNLGPLIYGVMGHWLSRSTCAVLEGEHAELRDDEKTFKRRILRKLLYRRCDLVHSVSRALRDEMHEFGVPEEKLRVTINGVDCERYHPPSIEEKAALRQTIGIPRDAQVLGILSRFGPFKRHLLLLEAFEKLAGDHPELVVLMVGDHGSEKEKVLAMRDASPFRDRIIWAGFQIDPVPFVQAMDLLIIPSVNEGLSNAMLESMACGLPCLTHSACGAAEVIENDRNGFLREMSSASLLAEELAQLVSDPERLKQVGQVARQDAVERYSLQAMIDTYEKLYRESASISESRQL